MTEKSFSIPYAAHILHYTTKFLMKLNKFLGGNAKVSCKKVFVHLLSKICTTFIVQMTVYILAVNNC